MAKNSRRNKIRCSYSCRMILLYFTCESVFLSEMLNHYNMTCCMQNQGRVLDERLWSVIPAFILICFLYKIKVILLTIAVQGGTAKYKKKLDSIQILYNSGLKQVQKLSCGEYRISTMPILSVNTCILHRKSSLFSLETSSISLS